MLYPSHKVSNREKGITLPSTMVDTPAINFPATEAMEIARRRLPEREYKRVWRQNCSLEAPESSAHRSPTSWDVSDLLKAVQPVEESITFPTIEWECDGEEEDTLTDDGVSQKILLSDSGNSALGKRDRSGSSPLRRLPRAKSLKVSLCEYGAESCSWSLGDLQSYREMPNYSIGRSRSSDASPLRREAFTKHRSQIHFTNMIVAPFA